MEYTEVKFSLSPFNEENAEILMAMLSELPFESFNTDEEALYGYIPGADFSPQLITENLLDNLPFECNFAATLIADQNWNKVWEDNYFQPIVIGSDCLVRGSFHEVTEKAKYEIIIDPKMSFGSGHHETTKMMLGYVIEQDCTGKTALDMGCGTGIIAILASMHGASWVDAIDIDLWSFNNTTENIEVNKCKQIKVLFGGVELIEPKNYDFIFANINRNVLLDDMHAYIAALAPTGKLFMSGFYENDALIVVEKANSLGMVEISRKTDNNWCAVCLTKKL